MILIDYNGIAIGNIVTQRLEIEENLIRHMILNSIRMYRKKFKHKYGEVVICCDAGGNWRKDVFPEYKASRKKSREDSSIDWDKVWPIINGVRDELRDNFPYKLIHVHKCEADDIIGSLCEYTNQFGNYEDVMIISSDKDFVQLQKWKNINQFSTNTKKIIKEESPRDFLLDQIFRGDASDGVPNVLSPDDIFLRDGERQTSLTAKRKQAWMKSDNLLNDMGEEIYRNYIRNKKMIDLSQTPADLVQKIINSFESQTVAPKSKVMPFLINKKCRNLLEDLNDFIM